MSIDQYIYRIKKIDKNLQDILSKGITYYNMCSLKSNYPEAKHLKLISKDVFYHDELKKYDILFEFKVRHKSVDLLKYFTFISGGLKSNSVYLISSEGPRQGVYKLKILEENSNVIYEGTLDINNDVDRQFILYDYEDYIAYEEEEVCYFGKNTTIYYMMHDNTKFNKCGHQYTHLPIRNINTMISELNSKFYSLFDCIIDLDSRKLYRENIASALNELDGLSSKYDKNSYYFYFQC